MADNDWMTQARAGSGSPRVGPQTDRPHPARVYDFAAFTRWVAWRRTASMDHRCGCISINVPSLRLLGGEVAAGERDRTGI
jgi:hypothetical protein